MQSPTLGKLAVAFATLASAAFATNVAAQPFCGDTIVADTTLTSDLLMCPGLGLGIGASGVTLDCAGHTIEATGGFVVRVDANLNDVTVTNCVMIGTAPTDALRVQGGTTNILITGNDITTSGVILARGIRFRGTSFSEISNNTISTSGGSSDGVRIDASSDNLVADNTISTSGDFARGFRVQSGSGNNVLSGNIVHTVGVGASGVFLRFAFDNIVERNVLRADKGEPVRFDSASGNVLDGNTLVSAIRWLESRRFPLQGGGLSVHPDGRIFAVENNFGGPAFISGGTVTTFFEVDATTGRAASVTRLTEDGIDIDFGFDALEITPDGRFLALRGGNVGELYEIDPDTGVVTFLFGLPNVNGLESNGIGFLLATNRNGDLYSIDLVSKISTLIGASGAGWSDVAVDPTTGMAYASSRRSAEASATSHLYEIDIATGAIIQEIGDIGLAFLSDIDFAADGTLYGDWDGSLVMIDPATAATEFLSRYFGEDPFEPPSEGNILSKTTLVALGGSGSVHYPGTLAVPSGVFTSVSTEELEISFNRVFLDSAIHPFLDQEAVITLLGLPGEKRRLLVDEDDDGVFEICHANMCRQQLFAGGTLVFEVDGITTFSSEEKNP